LIGICSSFDCRIVQVADVGTHDVLFCRVMALQKSYCADNLIYFGRKYHVVSACTARESVASDEPPRLREC